MSQPQLFVGIDVAKAQLDIAVRPTPCPLPDAQTEELRALLARRRKLVAMRTAEQNRFDGASQRLRVDSQAHITWLDTHLATLDDDLDMALRASPIWREHEALLRSVSGIGPVSTRTLLLDLPALGTVSRQRLAALVGVAPFHRDSGTMRGVQATWVGRTHVRTTLYMRTLVAVPGKTTAPVHLSSRTAIRAWAVQRLQARSGQFTSRHYQSGTLFDALTSDAARIRTMVRVTHQGVAEAAPRPTLSGVYHDHWRKTPTGCRLAHRAAYVDRDPGWSQ